MARQRARNVKRLNLITCESGNTWVTSDCLDVLFKPRWWFLQVQPKLLLPSLRRGNRKLIVAKGRNRGWAELRQGLIPLSRYQRVGDGFRVSTANMFRRLTGFWCRPRERNYALVKIGKWKFVVTYRFTEDDLLVGEAYDKETEYQIGTFIFLEGFEEVRLYCASGDYRYTMQVIAGYIADSMVYSLVAEQLNRKVKIVG